METVTTGINDVMTEQENIKDKMDKMEGKLDRIEKIMKNIVTKLP